MSTQTLPLSLLMQNTYAYLDEASGQTSKKLKTSRTAIVVGAQDNIGRIFVLYIWAGRVTPTDIVKEVIRAHTLYHPKMFGVESNAQQNLFAQLLTDLIHREGIRDFAPVYVKPPLDKTKIERIKNAVQPMMRSGRLLLDPLQHAELKREIDTFPTGQTNDLIDALAGMIALVPPLHEPRRDTTTHDAIRQYLSNNGMSDMEIAVSPVFSSQGPSFIDDPLLKITRARFSPK